MTSQNQIINHLKQKRQLIRRMLMPGTPATRTKQATSTVTSFQLFGGGKFKLAAQKMRFLGHNYLGGSDPIKLDRFSKRIPQKFSPVKKLLHFSPDRSSSEDLWTEINRTLPNQPQQSEPPARPGEFRRGTVITPMFPKPGQPVEAFKEQVSKVSTPAGRRGPATSRVIDPKSRLFSHVQEISPGDEPTQETAPTHAEADPTKTPPAQQSSPDRIQRQPELFPETATRKTDTSPEETLPAEDEIETQPPPTTQEIPRVEPEATVQDSSLQAVEVHTRQPTPLKRAQPHRGTSPPTSEQLIPRAKPLRKENQTGAGQAFPQARPETIPVPQEQPQPSSPTPPRDLIAEESVTTDLDQGEVEKQQEETTAAQPYPRIETVQAIPKTPQPEPPARTPGESPTESQPTQEMLEEITATIPSQKADEVPEPTPELGDGEKDETASARPGEAVEPPTGEAKAAPTLTPTERTEQDLSLSEGETLTEVLDSSTLPAQPQPDTADQGLIEELGPSRLDMPLREMVASRQEGARTMRAFQPAGLKPTTRTPTIIQRQRSLDLVQRHRPRPGILRTISQEGQRPEREQPFSQVSDSEPVRSLTDLPFETPQPEFRKESTFKTTTSATRSSPMDLVHAAPAERSIAPQQISAVAQLPLTPQLTHQPEFLEQDQLISEPQSQMEVLAPESPQTAAEPPQLPVQVKTVQRDIGTTGITETAESDQDTDRINLDQLAEKVLPRVKRILEIESERLSRHNR